MNAKLILSIQKQRKANLKAIAEMYGRNKQQDISIEADILLAEVANQNTDHDMFWRFV